MSVTATNISTQFDTGTHDCMISTLLIMPDGSQQPLKIQLPGYQYDLTASLLSRYVNPASLTNGAAGPVTPGDVALFWCAVRALEKAPAPTTSPASMQTNSQPDIRV